MSAYSRSSQKLVFTSLIHYSQGLICITKENVSSSLICRNRLILTNTHKLIHKRISICYFATINLTRILKLAHHSSEIGIRTKISYLKWSLLTANVTWVLSPSRGTALAFHTWVCSAKIHSIHSREWMLCQCLCLRLSFSHAFVAQHLLCSVFSR